MLIEFDYKDDVCIIRPRGRFVTGSDAEYLRKKTDELKSCGRTKVMTDLHDVPYADSTGIAFIVGAYTSAKAILDGYIQGLGGLLPDPRVREVLDLTRLSTVIPIVADEAAGFAFLNAEGPAARGAEQK